VLTPSTGTTGLADHTAVTPAGSPLTCKLIGPLKDPPVPTDQLIAAIAPLTTATDASDDVSVSTGATA
jgi:hypothetical protein